MVRRPAHPHADDGGPVEAFAGPARWEQPIFTWEHHLDWLGTFPSDAGTFEADGADLIDERGTFVDDGRAVPYAERWERVAVPGDSGSPAWRRRPVAGARWSRSHPIAWCWSTNGPTAAVRVRRDDRGDEGG